MCTQNTAPFARLQQSHIRTIASATQPRASKAAALPGSRGARVHLRSLSACTLARKGKPSKCARQIRAGIAIICAAPSSSTIAQMLPAPHRVTQPRASEAAALPDKHRCMRASAIGSGHPICAQRQAAKMRAACARVKQKCTRRFASARQVTGVALSSSYPGWTGPCQQPVLLILDWADGSDRYVVVHARPPVPLAAPIAFASKSSHAE